MIVSTILNYFQLKEKDRNAITVMVATFAVIMLLGFMYNAGLAIGEAYAHFTNARA
jgi:hypothetical protein